MDSVLDSLRLHELHPLIREGNCQQKYKIILSKSYNED
jgi:hypothetical protein